MDLHAGGAWASLQWLSFGGLRCSYVNAIQPGLLTASGGRWDVVSVITVSLKGDQSRVNRLWNLLREPFGLFPSDLCRHPPVQLCPLPCVLDG